jgi:hypothetical protein
MSHLLFATKLLSLAMVIFLIGCAVPTTLRKPGASLDQEQKDYAECRLEAAKATASASGTVIYDQSTAVVHDAVAAQRQEQILARCLVARGYQRLTNAQFDELNQNEARLKREKEEQQN